MIKIRRFSRYHRFSHENVMNESTSRMKTSRLMFCIYFDRYNNNNNNNKNDIANRRWTTMTTTQRWRIERSGVPVCLHQTYRLCTCSITKRCQMLGKWQPSVAKQTKYFRSIGQPNEDNIIKLLNDIRDVAGSVSHISSVEFRSEKPKSRWFSCKPYFAIYLFSLDKYGNFTIISIIGGIG